MRDRDSPLDGVAAAACGGDDNCAQHHRGRQDALSRIRVDRPRNVPLRDVGDFVRDDSCEFVLVPGCLEKSRMHANVAAGQGKGVDSRVLHGEKRELVIAFVRLGRNPAADGVEVLGYQGIFHDLAAVADVAHDHAPDLSLGAVVENRVGRAAEIWQAYIVGPGAGHEYQRPEKRDEQGAFDNA